MLVPFFLCIIVNNETYTQMYIKKRIKSILKIELLLSILFFLTPIILFVFQDKMLGSISEYAYSDIWYLYITMLSTCGLLYMVDGVVYKFRRYNIVLGICLICVVIFPSEEWRLTHNTFAIIFFLGNSFVVTYHSTIISKQFKLFISSIVIVALSVYFIGFINLFLAESIGLFIISFFMFMRFLRIIMIK